MLCDECKSKEATVHIKKIINGQKEEMHLCEECAKAKSDFELFKPSFSVQDLLAGFFQQLEPGVRGETPPGTVQGISEKCSVCGLSLEDFRRTGRLGCGRCYEQFEEQLNPILRRLHGSTRHTGKIPSKSKGVARLRRKKEELRRELQEVIAAEEYERAAQLRDEIRRIESQIDGGEV
jgi:protein arginine kinase activator